MTTTQQSQAQKLAALLSTESESEHSGVKYSTAKASAAELRRLHARVVELESQLEAIGAGGVESLRKKDAARTRTIDSGALQMVINALRRDASEGKAIRGEMADELEKVIE